jgi:hypothetical protein
MDKSYQYVDSSENDGWRDKMICPKCGSCLHWAIIGYDSFGKIQELQCSQCLWSEEDAE